MLHPPQRKEQKHLIESAKKEVEPVILAANCVKVGIAQGPETGTSSAKQKRLQGFLQCPLDGQGEINGHARIRVVRKEIYYSSSFLTVKVS